MLRAVVVVVCLASAGIIAVYTRYSDTGDPVYTVQARAPEPAPPPPPPTVATRPIDPTDRAALARALQRELKRVGCYQGEITGVWTTSSRMAMKTFNERVNATLPVDNPDPVLLSQVQGRPERTCASACPPGQTPTEGDACALAAAAAKPGKAPEAKSEAERPADALPAAGTAAVAGTAAAAALAASGGAKTDAKAPAAPAKAAAPGTVRSAAGETSGPVPPESMARDRKPRRSAETSPPPPRPPKVVRDVLRALGFN
jgi:hypothetical protein